MTAIWLRRLAFLLASIIIIEMKKTSSDIPSSIGETLYLMSRSNNRKCLLKSMAEIEAIIALKKRQFLEK